MSHQLAKHASEFIAVLSGEQFGSRTIEAAISDKVHSRTHDIVTIVAHNWDMPFLGCWGFFLRNWAVI